MITTDNEPTSLSPTCTKIDASGLHLLPSAGHDVFSDLLIILPWRRKAFFNRDLLDSRVCDNELESSTNSETNRWYGRHERRQIQQSVERWASSTVVAGQLPVARTMWYGRHKRRQIHQSVERWASSTVVAGQLPVVLTVVWSPQEAPDTSVGRALGQQYGGCGSVARRADSGMVATRGARYISRCPSRGQWYGRHKRRQIHQSVERWASSTVVAGQLPARLQWYGRHERRQIHQSVERWASSTVVAGQLPVALTVVWSPREAPDTAVGRALGQQYGGCGSVARRADSGMVATRGARYSSR
ncbi:hypothetical protein RRG08_060670 [Elysia crispata]|uniref:Uncharacterized protein n=1 Tax=Elysia crispata TaxID=231223 RepID=A0AAE1E3T7_9GAST|nr:hypothetical protein RRG08_060670 [Elysia crispata]